MVLESAFALDRVALRQGNSGRRGGKEPSTFQVFHRFAGIRRIMNRYCVKPGISRGCLLLVPGGPRPGRFLLGFAANEDKRA